MSHLTRHKRTLKTIRKKTGIGTGKERQAQKSKKKKGKKRKRRGNNITNPYILYTKNIQISAIHGVKMITVGHFINNLGVVYKISQNSCPLVYIGQIDNSFATRLNQHCLALRLLHPQRLQVAEHAILESHSIDWEFAKFNDDKQFHFN